MPTLFEVFGFPLEDRSKEAETSRALALCPFMRRDCDGGGNRYLSHIHLSDKPDLARMYPNRETIPSGVCSIRVKPEGPPWIVCPRRLLVLGNENEAEYYQEYVEKKTLGLFGYPSGTRLGVWPEVKLKYREKLGDADMQFDYTFDYILMPLERIKSSQIESTFGVVWADHRHRMEGAGYTIARRGNEDYVEDCPHGIPSVIEIMTSSTSGGDQKKRTAIPLAFEDAILHRTHKAPGINYRQVWARMASQLIVKSEIALEWGGKTIWVVQDLLADYISSTTALKLNQFISEHASEVNMLAFSYGDAHKKVGGVIKLEKSVFYAGPISAREKDGPEPIASFQDIVRVGILPSLKRLLVVLSGRKPATFVTVP